MSPTGFAGCGVCGKAITNPICPACLETEMLEWLAVKKGKAKVADFVRLASIKLIQRRNAGVKCIICGYSFSMCPHCYCKEVYTYLCNSAPCLKQEFLTHFGVHFRLLWVLSRY